MNARSAHIGRRAVAAVLGTAVVVTGVLMAMQDGTSGTTVKARTAAAAGDAGKVRLTLPAPTGPHPVGTVSLGLLDRSRRDPWMPALPYRELMVSVRYPARDTAGRPRAPQMLPGEAAGFDALNNYGDAIPKGKVDWSATLSHAYENAPVARGSRPLPVVLYSPGVLDPRSLGTTLADDLASRGYVVVTIDHTYDATAVQFPGGRVEHSVLPQAFAATGGDGTKVTALLKKTMAARVADTRSVLDAVDALAAGHDPDADGRALPPGLAGAPDAHRIGMFGQSGGGMAAAETMHDDPRIKAGVDMDGVLAYVQDDHTAGRPFPVAADGLDRPMLLMGEEGDDHHSVPSWGLLWEHSTGWHRDLTLLGGAHASFTDGESLVPQIRRALRLPASAATGIIGTAPPAGAVTAQEACVASFFDRWLDGRDNGLLNGPSPRLPQIRFVS